MKLLNLNKKFFFSLIVFLFISCLGAGKLNLLNKNKINRKAKIYKKKVIIFFFIDTFEVRRPL